ncbi:30S ribosomal protein S11 [Candidatus Peregrinibacteria bacterium]|nr:30S ribosomal protein S11 [Candidatus Peregrinibacteria bacterium]
MADDKKKSTRKKPKKRLVTDGKAYIQASFNNTIVTITDEAGEVLGWSSAGANGFKGPKKATPYAAQVAAEKAVENAKVYGVERVHVFIKGAGTGREQSIRGLQNGGIQVESLTDTTAIPHNGCRAKKTRRV